MKGGIEGGLPGYFYPPKAWADVPHAHCVITEEEAFGPVVAITRCVCLCEWGGGGWR